MKTTITLLTFALVAATMTLSGCEYPIDESNVEADRPLGTPAGVAREPGQNPPDTFRDGDSSAAETLAADDPTGHILMGEVDFSVEVGELVVITFMAELHDIDPEDTYFTIEALPEGALVDFGAGVIEWTPTPSDIGIHVLGLDLWDGGAERVLDAQRVAIEVLPGTSLIEVGI